MSRHTRFPRVGLRKIATATMLAGVIALGVAGCHNKKDGSNTSSGSITNATAQTQTTAAAQAAAQGCKCDRFPGGGNVYKPVSESDGRLVVLLSSNYAADTPVTMLDGKNCNAIERGRPVGRTNGSRPTFRFSRPGRSFPSPGVLKVGSNRFWCIPNTASRYD
jgi:hypothetical protein